MKSKLTKIQEPKHLMLLHQFLRINLGNSNLKLIRRIKILRKKMRVKTIRKKTSRNCGIWNLSI